MDTLSLVALGVASIGAGAINSVAGGGSLVSFPVAVLLGMPPLIANATNAVGLTPGTLASGWAYRREIAQDRRVLALLTPPALVGGVLGGGLLLLTPQGVFDTIVPLLVLFATGLLLYQNVRPPRLRGDASEAWSLPERTWVPRLVQLAVGIYGGYFGAGIGIMMLASFTLLGARHIHRMNGVKVVLAGAINATASVLFLAAGAVDLPGAAAITVGSSLGGIVGASMARRADPKAVRWVVVAIGVALTASLAWKRWA